MLPKRLRNYLIHFIVRNLLKSITEEELLRVNKNGKIICRGRVITREMQDQIQVEAEYIKNSITFKLVTDDMKYLANQTMFEKSSKFDDMVFGKAMLYVIDVLIKKIHNLAK